MLGFFLTPLVLIVLFLLPRVGPPSPSPSPAEAETLLIPRSPYDPEPGVGLSAIGSSVALPDTKPCPRCAETIKRAALVCRFCRADFEAESLGVQGAMVGDTVIHPALGNGVIVRIEVGGVALVQFSMAEIPIQLQHLKAQEQAMAVVEGASP
ncbi:hypothetical protein SAMN02982994_0764 [Azospirillum lipoferum]|nr:hypothetical protein SAMN02982994_0764 [Azospirillum lipoferum]